MVKSMNATHPELHQLVVPGLSVGDTAAQVSNLVQQQAVMVEREGLRRGADRPASSRSKQASLWGP
jgi:hypothetical protein